MILLTIIIDSLNWVTLRECCKIDDIVYKDSVVLIYPLATTIHFTLSTQVQTSQHIKTGPEEAILKWSGQGVGTMKC